MKYKVGDKVRVRSDLIPSNQYGGLTFFDGNMSSHAGQLCTIKRVYSNTRCEVYENPFTWSIEMLEPADSKIVRMADGTIIGEFNTGGTLPTSEWSKLIFKNGSSIEVLPQKDDTVKEEKNLKFTFYTIEGYRMDKSNNTKIPTVTTEVVYKDKDGCATGGSATCDKADYNSRQGVLEALANMCCGGNFDREYNKAVKDNARADKISRTCTYCGQLFDTVAEKDAHEAWHVERRKARHERYLLRKRAKEIAFEEQAQKMAKEMMGEQK